MKDTVNPFEDVTQVINDVRKVRLKLEREELFIDPVENPKSECFQCGASMCHHQYCRGDRYHWLQNINYE